MTLARINPARPSVLFALIAVQAVCAAVFLADIVADLFVFHDSGPMGGHVYFEAAATISLIVAIAVEARILAWLMRRKKNLEISLRTAQGAIQDVIDSEFYAWGLTPAEQDVATFLVKGLSIAEIAEMRGSATGTVKVQLNSIYRKSDTANRAELMSHLIDTLMGHDVKVDQDEPLARSA